MSGHSEKEISFLSKAVHEICTSIIELINSSRKEIYEIEKLVVSNLNMTVHGGSKNLSTARRIIQALENRLDKIQELTREPTLDNLKNAYNMAFSKLCLTNDTLNKLITEDDIQPIEVNKIKTTIDHLLDNVIVKKQKKISIF